MTWFDFIQKLSFWDWLFWSLVLIDFVWLALPPLVYVLYGSLSTHRVELGMDDADLPVDPRLGIQLLALGLQPLGAITTRDWLTFNGWNKHVKQYVFGGGDGRYLVLVWITYEGESPYLRFLSFFANGHVEGTTNEFAGRFIHDKNAATGLMTFNVEHLAQLHRNKVNELTAAGFALRRHDSLALLTDDYRQGKRLPWGFRCLLVAGRLVMFIALIAALVAMKVQFGSDTLLVFVGMVFMHLIPLLLWAGDKSAGSKREDLLATSHLGSPLHGNSAITEPSK